MSERNEAAERLRENLRAAYGEGSADEETLDDALAAERRATVERIREHLQTFGRTEGDGLWAPAVWSVLDAERRATVERIRERSVAQTWVDRREDDEDRITLADLHVILDEEAER